MCLPNRLYSRGCQADSLGHRAQCPMGRLMGRQLLRQSDDLCHALGWDRCPTRRTGLIAQEAIYALVHEPLLPAPHAGLRLARRRHDGRGPETVYPSGVSRLA
jgi:hypothetical protein